MGNTWDKSGVRIKNDKVIACDPERTGGVVLPLGVKEIGDAAFRSIRIASVTLPDTLTSVGDESFKRCAPARQARPTFRVGRGCNSSRREDRVKTLSFTERELFNIIRSTMPRGMRSPETA